MSALSHRIVATLIRFRIPLLIIGLAIAGVAYWPAQQLSFDQSVENMFAPDDPLLVPFRQVKRTFGGDEIVLAAYVDPQLLQPQGLARLDGFTRRLATVPGVQQAFSLTQAPFFSPNPSPLSRLANSPLLGQLVGADDLKQKFLELSEGYTIGPDRQTAAVICLLAPERSAEAPRSQTIHQLREATRQHDPSGVLAGEPVMVVDGFRYLQEDGERLGLLCSVLLMITILACFRSVRWTIAPMIVVQATLCVTQAILVWGALSLSMVSSMLWAIVTVIGVATSVHVIVRYRETRGSGLPPTAALLSAAAALAAPIAWSCVTDAAGFASLLVSQVGPVRDFGVMMVIGSLVTLVMLAMLGPGLSLVGAWDAPPRCAWGEGFIDRGLTAIILGIERRPKLWGGAIAVTMLVAIAGVARLEVETDFTRNFRADSPIVRSYAFVEERLGGAGAWDIIVPIPQDGSPDFFARVRSLEAELRSEVTVLGPDGVRPGLTKVLSVVDALDALPISAPQDPRQLAEVIPLMQKYVPLVGALYGRDPQRGDRPYLRIMLRSAERQSSQQKEALIHQVTRRAQQAFPEAQVTGFFVLLTRLIESTTRDQWLTFGVATTAIGLMMWLAFRNLPLALVTLAPNALPILVVTGMMGWLGLKINMGAAMIASVSMGLAIDSSVHYVTAFRRSRLAGADCSAALHAAQGQVGPPMVFSTLALIVGFSALCFSHFVPTIYFGALVSLAMLGGLLGNLAILPLLLILVPAAARIYDKSTHRKPDAPS